MLSDQDIKKLLNREIVIYPYRETDLTPVGYNLNPSDFAYSINDQELIPNNNGFFEVKPNDTALILTEEAVWVSKKIAGTFHSKVGVVSTGFGHISTTLDPNWKGPLLISLNNPTNKTLKLSLKKSFITLIFYKVRTPAIKDHDNEPSRKDILKGISERILAQEVTEQGRAFISKVQSIINNENASEEFEKKYLELTTKSDPAILEGLKKNFELERLEYYQHLLLKVFQYFLVVIIVIKVIAGISQSIKPLKVPVLNPFLTYVNQYVNKSDLIAIASLLVASWQVKNKYENK